jgi:hypothetical protein
MRSTIGAMPIIQADVRFGSNVMVVDDGDWVEV